MIVLSSGERFKHAPCYLTIRVAQHHIAFMQTNEIYRNRYPAIEPFNSGYLQVSKTHRIYFEQCGNPMGQAAIFLHGGPGAGCDQGHRQYFDPKHYHIILFDQRGCGRSEPFACLEENTTWDLVADIEKIREHLKIEKWLVFGGSWGSTLSLAYSITHPQRVQAMVLRGIFLCRKRDLDWFYQDGASFIFPEEWESYLAPIPENERANLMKAYAKRLTGDDEKVKLQAAKAWSKWEGSTIKLIPDKNTIDHFSSDRFSIAFARIENHFFTHGAFFKSDNWILENVSILKEHKIPGVIVHGRYDVCTPIEQAWELHKAWPEAKLEVIANAGHAASENGIVEALIRATDNFRNA
jgi:proline iminopeptidase